MKAVLAFIWSNRTSTMSVLQIMTASLATTDLVTGTPLKWVLYINGVLTGCIALHNKIREVRAERAAQEDPQ